MEIRSIDIILLFILALVVSIIIGYNIIYIIDKKLSNVVINVPPATIPKQNIIVKLVKSKNNEKYNKNIEKSKTINNSNNDTIELSDDTVELCDESGSDISLDINTNHQNKNNILLDAGIEPFNNTDISKKKNPTLLKVTGLDNINSNMTNYTINNANNVKFPEHDDIIKYTNKSCSLPKKNKTKNDIYHPLNINNIPLKNKYIPAYLESNSLLNGIKYGNIYDNADSIKLITNKSENKDVQTFNYY